MTMRQFDDWQMAGGEGRLTPHARRLAIALHDEERKQKNEH